MCILASLKVFEAINGFCDAWYERVTIRRECLYILTF
jgi:hypothetical protein